jgi:hypothetical protein
VIARRVWWRRVRTALVGLGALAVAACGRTPSHIVLPTGTGEPAGDPQSVAGAAFRRCGDLHTLTAAVAVSGWAGRQRIRARLLAGFASPGAIRLEAVAPFGRPGFILAADARAATLLLPRDGRVLTGAAPADILSALSGIPLSPDDLRQTLAGCPPGVAALGATRYGTDWLVIDYGAAGRGYLRSRGSGWVLTAFARPGLVAEYPERYANPYAAAERGYIDDVIDPADTRSKLVAGLAMLKTKREELPRRKHGNMPL